MSISARYHSICSSDYLKEDWLAYFGRVEINFDQVGFLTTDFRTTGQSFFNLLRILCQTSSETIENALFAFRNNRLVTMNVLSAEEFYLETSRRMKSFQSQTIASFVHLIQFIRTAIQTNQLAEGIWTNLGPFSIYNNETNEWSLKFRPRDFYTNSCSCALSNECTRPVGFYWQNDNSRSKPNQTVPGLVLGCFVIDSVLLSTLECLYEKQCIQMLVDNYDFDVQGLVYPLNDHAKNIKSLSNENSRFLPNTTINEIFSQLFLEEWVNASNYSSYYHRCQPSQCTYSIGKRFSFSFMTTKMLAFCGGLSALLSVLVPPIVKLFIQRKRSTDDNRQSLRGRISQKFRRLNIFVDASEEGSIIATRIYIFLFLMIMIGAFLYYGPLNLESKTTIHENPSIDLFEKLHSNNLTRFSCPCSKVSIPYSKILSIEPVIHPICSTSQNIDSQSLELITHHRILSSYCALSRDYIDHWNEVFEHREMITVETLTNHSFDIQFHSLTKNFLHQIKSEYRRRISFVLKSFHVNQLLHLFLTNWKIDFTNGSGNYVIQTVPHTFSSSNCTCAITSKCHEKFNDEIEIGCFPYDGFRLSKHENISFGLLNHRLFVQQWIKRRFYENYFNECHPLKCEYTEFDRNNPESMFTNLLELYGSKRIDCFL